ncbi:MAG TPA: NifU family protein [Gemmataceae bacterium]|nr:NifU family protein [Gemmataceae bacterium]
MAADQEFPKRMQRIEALVQALEELPDPTARDTAREMVRALLELHSAGLARLLELVAGVGGQALLDRLARDDLVGSLLLLHGLHPVDLEARVRQALERVGSRLRAHGAEVELISLDGGTARLRLRGGGASTAALRQAIEDALTEAAPDVTTLAIEEASPPDGTRFALPIVPPGG